MSTETRKKPSTRASPTYTMTLSGDAITMLHRIVVGLHLGGPSTVRTEIEETLGSVTKVVLKHRATQIAHAPLEKTPDGEEAQERARPPGDHVDTGAVQASGGPGVH